MGLERAADGDVTVDRYHDDQPNRHRLGYRSQRPDVGFPIRKIIFQMSDPTGHLLQGFQGLDEHAGDQIDRVDDCQRLKQHVGRVGLVWVPAKDGDRQSVADKPDQAEGADHVDVDYDARSDVQIDGRAPSPEIYFLARFPKREVA